MSNYLAIAAVTASIQAILGEAESVVSGARVASERPGKDDAEVSTPRVNLLLYEVAPHAAWRSTDLREQVAVDLRYLLTFHGDEQRYEPQLLLGSVVRRLHEEPELTPERILEAEAQILGYSTAATSDLALQDDPVRLTPLSLSLEDLSKVWTALFQAPFALSVAYQAGAVLIDREGQQSAVLEHA